MFDLLPSPATTEALGEFGAYKLSEVMQNALISLVVPKDRVEGARRFVREQYGLELPESESICVNHDQSYAAFWIARSQWMLERPELHDPNWAVTLAAENIGYVTEQTGAWVRLDLEGPMLSTLFQRLANVPSERLVEPTAMRTAIHHLGVFVVCRSSCISIYGPRSSADSLVRSVKFAIHTINGLENKYEV